MASVYKRGGRWYIVFTDEQGRRKGRAGYTDKRETEKLARKLEDEAAARRDGLIDDAQARLATHGRAPIVDHLEAYLGALRAKGNAEAYRARVRSDLERVIGDIGWETLRDVTGDRFTAYLADQADQYGLGPRTLNARRQSVRGFIRWCLRQERLASDPLAGVGSFRESGDRRRVRRAFTAEEVRQLVSVTAAGPKRCRTAGADRAMFYALLAGTGLRRSEAASLTRESFRLDGDTPSVVVAAGYSKRRREDEQPIPNALAARLRVWLANRPKGKHLWRLPANPHRVWLRPDLRAARAAWLLKTADGSERRRRREESFLAERDAQGRVLDFHAFRHGYITAVVSSGAPVSVAQRLARHSTPMLTLGVYSTVNIADERKALDVAFEEKAEPAATTLEATGTEGESVAHTLRAAGRDGQSPSVAGSSRGRRGADAGRAEVTRNQGSTRSLSFAGSGGQGKPPTGIEPVTSRLQITRSAN